MHIVIQTNDFRFKERNRVKAMIQTNYRNIPDDEVAEPHKKNSNGLFDDYENSNDDFNSENSSDLYDDEIPQQTEKKQKSSSQKITMVQICTCVIVLIAAVVVKTMGGEVYASVKQWYTQHINDSIVAQDSGTSGKEAFDRVIKDAMAQIKP